MKTKQTYMFFQITGGIDHKPSNQYNTSPRFVADVLLHLLHAPRFPIPLRHILIFRGMVMTMMVLLNHVRFGFFDVTLVRTSKPACQS